MISAFGVEHEVAKAAPGYTAGMRLSRSFAHKGRPELAQRAQRVALKKLPRDPRTKQATARYAHLERMQGKDLGRETHALLTKSVAQVRALGNAVAGQTLQRSFRAKGQPFLARRAGQVQDKATKRAVRLERLGKVYAEQRPATKTEVATMRSKRKIRAALRPRKYSQGSVYADDNGNVSYTAGRMPNVGPTQKVAVFTRGAGLPKRAFEENLAKKQYGLSETVRATANHPQLLAFGGVAGAAGATGAAAPKMRDERDRKAARTVAAAGLGAAAGQAAYQAAGFAPQKAARRRAGYGRKYSDITDPAEKKAFKTREKQRKAHQKAHTGPTGKTDWKSYYRSYPKEHPGAKVYRALGHTHHGSSGRVLGTAATLGASAAAVAAARKAKKKETQ